MTSHKPLQNSVPDSFTNRFPGQIRLGRLTANSTNATLPLLGGQVFNDAHIWPFTCVRVSSLASKVSLWGCGDVSLRRRTRKLLRIVEEKKKESSLAQFVRLLGKHEGIFQYKLSCWSLFFLVQKVAKCSQLLSLQRLNANSKHHLHHAGVDLIIWGAGPAVRLTYDWRWKPFTRAPLGNLPSICQILANDFAATAPYSYRH